MSRLARLGFFIFMTLIMLGAAVFIIGDRQFLFSHRYTVQASFNNVAGLINGADVRIGGVRKGTVGEIRLPNRPGEQVSVVMKLEASTRKVIKKDSIATIETEGLLGNKYVTVSFGSPNSDPIHDGDTLQSRPPIDLSDLVKKTDQIMDAASMALRNVGSATANIDDITSKIDRGEGTVGALINDRKIYDEFNATASEAHKTVDEAKVGVTAFQENMQALKKNWFFRKFFKDRGYQDISELTKYSIDQLPEESPLQVFTYEARKLFDKQDNAKLKNEKSLNRVGEFLEKNPFGLIVVTANQGRTGDHDENLMLSQARAGVVRQYLAKKFNLDDTRIKTKGLGEDTTNSDGKGERIQILVYPHDVKLVKNMPKRNGPR